MCSSGNVLSVLSLVALTCTDRQRDHVLGSCSDHVNCNLDYGQLRNVREFTVPIMPEALHTSC